MKLHSIALTLLFLTAATGLPAFADSINYQNAGHVAPEVPTFAAATGGVNVYFGGSTAAAQDSVELLDLNTGFNSGTFFPNHTTANGAMLSIGTGPGQINAGDQLIFLITSSYGTFSSIAARNADNINHAFISTYAGNGRIPAGLFVGLEDQPLGHSDLNYRDDTLFVTGVNAPSLSVTPEPNSLLLLGTGLLSTVTVLRRKYKAAA